MYYRDDKILNINNLAPIPPPKADRGKLYSFLI